MSNQILAQHQSDLDVINAHYKQQLSTSAITDPQAATADWFEVFTKFLTSVWQVLGKSGSTADVKAAIVAAALAFYRDAVAPLLSNMLGRPFIFNSIIGPLIERFIPVVVGGIVDGLFKTTVATQAPNTPTPGPQPGGGFVPY